MLKFTYAVFSAFLVLFLTGTQLWQLESAKNQEVLTLADKILVLYRGSVVHEAVGTEVDVEAVGLAMAGLS